jgi:hypothetical protein
MTEAEWLACTSPEPMLSFLGAKANDRKLLLFGVACCRYIWRKLSRSLRSQVEAVESYADGLLTYQEMQRARVITEDPWPAGVTAVSWLFWEPGRVWARAEIAAKVAREARRGDTTEECHMQANLLRDVLGNPFHQAALPDVIWLRWRDGMVPNLARWSYENRAFKCLPILADALEDAGCADRDILDHLRGPGPHVRGCWALDLLLGLT